jgi:predicted MFS family arabinose efflux permease
VGGIVLAIIEGPTRGWASAVTVAGFAVSLVAGLAFVRWELRSAHPLLDVRMFAGRGVRSGSLSIFVQFIVGFGFLFVAVSYLAFSRHYGPLDLGLALIPMGLGLLPASMIAFPLSRRISRRVLGTIGLLIIAASFVIGTRITEASELWVFLAVLITFGAGFGLSAPPATSAIVESLPAAKQGVASALNDVLRELGAALGIAVAGAVFNDAYRSSIGTAPGIPDAMRELVRDAPAAAGPLSTTLGDKGGGLLDGVSHAVIDGWHTTMWTLAGIGLMGALGFLAWSPRQADS